LSFGVSPECSKCHSLERHRIIHEIYKAILPLLSQWRALQFAPDQSVDATWFAKFDASNNDRIVRATSPPNFAHDLSRVRS
jgi:hypothetical protein